MYTVTSQTQIDWKAVFKLGLETISNLIPNLHLFSTFHQRLRTLQEERCLRRVWLTFVVEDT